MYVALQELELRPRMPWGTPPVWAALNIMCNLSKGWARRHGRGDVMTSWYKSTCGETGVSFFVIHQSALCVYCLFILLWVLFGVVCPENKLNKMSKRHYKGESSTQYKQCFITEAANVSLLQVTHTACARSAWERSTHSRHSRVPAVRIVIFFQCTCFAPGRLSLMKEPSPAFPAVLVPLPPRRSGVGTRGARKWICWRGWRRASPYFFPHPSDSAATPRDRKPVLRTLPPGARARRFAFHPPRRVNVRALRLRPLSRPGMRSCWRW